MKEKLQEIDETLGYLVDQLKSHHLLDKLNLIITSDHGMESVSEEKSIFLDSYVDLSLFDPYGSRTCINLFLKDSKFQKTVILFSVYRFNLCLYCL